MINVAVSGAAGRMGETVCAAVEGADDMALVGRADPLLQVGLPDVLGDADVIVDFSTPDSALHNARTCLEAGVHCVMGTTGADFSELEGVGDANLFVAPNFAIGAVLMMRFAEQAAQHLPECEIVELHHDRKVDAPSGTAARTAELVRAAGGNVHEPIHSVRLPGPRRAPGGPLRRARPDALDPPRLDRARVVHAGRAARGAQGRVARALAHRRARASSLACSRVSADRNRRLMLLGGALLAAVVVVVVAIVISQGGSDDEEQPSASGGRAQPSQSAEVEELFGGIPQQGVTLGEPDAPGDADRVRGPPVPLLRRSTRPARCPTVIEDYVRTGRLKLQLRLLRFIGPDSERGAEVAAAATLQDKGWEFSDLFFRNQGQENSGYATDQFLQRLARATPGLDVDQLESDLDTPQAQALIRQAERQANRLGVSGTPSFFVQKGNAAPQPLELSSLDAGSVTDAIESALGEQ